MLYAFLTHLPNTIPHSQLTLAQPTNQSIVPSNGSRHYILINLMYDTSSRVSELIIIRTEDLSYRSNNSIRIKGKRKIPDRLYHMTFLGLKIFSANYDNYL